MFADVPRKTHLVTHDVELSKDVSPIKQHAYRIDPMKREVMRKEVRFLLENGLAEPSCSAWSSPCILVQKGGGQWRLCTDYRKVNAVTKTDSYPIPRIDDCVDNVGQVNSLGRHRSRYPQGQVAPLRHPFLRKPLPQLSQHLMIKTKVVRHFDLLDLGLWKTPLYRGIGARNLLLLSMCKLIGG